MWIAGRNACVCVCVRGFRDGAVDAKVQPWRAKFGSVLSALGTECLG